MEDIFNTDFTMEENSQPPKMTKDEFIQKTRSMLQAIMDGYISNWKDKEKTCSRCNGFLYICEGGVGAVDCPSCKGTGRINVGGAKSPLKSFCKLTANVNNKHSKRI